MILSPQWSPSVTRGETLFGLVPPGRRLDLNGAPLLLEGKPIQKITTIVTNSVPQWSPPVTRGETLVMAVLSV